MDCQIKDDLGQHIRNENLEFHGIWSAAWPSSVKRCFYDEHDRKVDGSTPTQVLASLDKKLHDNYLC